MSLSIPAQDWVNDGRQWAINLVTDLSNAVVGVFDTDTFNIKNKTNGSTLNLRLGAQRLGNGETKIEFLSVNGGASAQATISRKSGTNGALDITQTGTGAVSIASAGGKVSITQNSVEVWKTDSVNTIVYNNMLHQGSQLAFFNASAASKLTVTGSRGGNAALTSLLTQLATYGLITNSTSA